MLMLASVLVASLLVIQWAVVSVAVLSVPRYYCGYIYARCNG